MSPKNHKHSFHLKNNFFALKEASKGLFVRDGSCKWKSSVKIFNADFKVF